MSTHFDREAANWDNEPRRVELMRCIGEKIVEDVQPGEEMKVLDYGCGTGLVGLYLLPHVGSVIGADSSRGMLEVLRGKIREGDLQNMEALQLDLERDPVPDSRHDMIVVSMALHHIAELDRVLRAFYELLSPEGILCLADLDTEPGTFHPPEVAESVHHHGFDRNELKGRLGEIGFAGVRNSTVVRFQKPTADGSEEEFSIFLISARRP